MITVSLASVYYFTHVDNHSDHGSLLVKPVSNGFFIQHSATFVDDAALLNLGLKSCRMSFPPQCVINLSFHKWSSRAQFLVGAGNFSLHYCIQNGSGAHLASYPIGTGGEVARV
jgi:hypothetical protein